MWNDFLWFINHPVLDFLFKIMTSYKCGKWNEEFTLSGYGAVRIVLCSKRSFLEVFKSSKAFKRFLILLNFENVSLHLQREHIWNWGQYWHCHYRLFDLLKNVSWGPLFNFYMWAGYGVGALHGDGGGDGDGAWYKVLVQVGHVLERQLHVHPINVHSTYELHFVHVYIIHVHRFMDHV